MRERAATMLCSFATSAVLLAAGASCSTAAWRNARERRWLQAGFWGVLALLFAGGDWILAARKAGDPLPAQLAGIGVIALALLALRMRREHLRRSAAANSASHRRNGWAIGCSCRRC